VTSRLGKFFRRAAILVPEFRDYPWSLPERILLALSPESESAHQEDTVEKSYDYLWLTSGQLQRCAEMFHSRVFLLDLLDRVYRPLLVTGRSAPFPVVVYLAVGYAMREIEIPGTLSRHIKLRSVIVNFIVHLNDWLSEILTFDFPRHQTQDEMRRVNLRRANWTALNQFIRRALSPREIGSHAEFLDPGLSDSQKLRDRLQTVEDNLLNDQQPLLIKNRPREFNDLEEYFSEVEERISRRLPQKRYFLSPEEEIHQRAREQQARAVRYYLSRAGVSGLFSSPTHRAPSSIPKENIINSNQAREKLLDLHALAGFQAFGRFYPDERTNLLLKLLRRELTDPTSSYRARESTVDGISRRGTIPQLLKWQMALKDKSQPRGQEYAAVYDRFFHQRMLYLRRVSQRSQELSLTLFFAIDLSAPALQKIANGSRQHSLAREVCAHLLQDCYQVLWQIPKLYADAVIVFHDRCRIVWKSVVVLTEGELEKPIAEDLFLQERPPWLRVGDHFADPSNYFQFILPSLITAPKNSGVERRPENNSLSEQFIETVRTVRKTRIAWLRGMKNGGAAGGGALPMADLLVTVVVPAQPPPPEESRHYFESLHSQGLLHQFWVCNCTDQIQLQHNFAVKAKSGFPSTLHDFQTQKINPDYQPPVSLRQQFVHTLLEGLLMLCAEAEIAI